MGYRSPKSKNISNWTGFLYGFSMGPFGLIIVALLNPDTNSKRYKYLYQGKKNMDNDIYKLYLINKYKIQKMKYWTRSFAMESHFYPETRC
jgi:hypothetical protein